MKQFENNQTVCFLGDSITNNNEWQMQIYSHYLKQGAKNLKIFCCGTSGGTAQQGYLYRNIDLYRYNPDHVSIMFGINDLRPTLYPDDADKAMIEKREKRFEDYKLYMRRLIDDITSRGITVNLCTPMPYDCNLVTDAGANYRGCSAAVEACAGFVRNIAAEYNLEYVDFNSVVTKLNKDIQKSMPDVSLISKDRIHPNPIGYNIMARIYLNSQGFDDISVPTADEILSGDVNPLPIDELMRKRGTVEADLRRIFSTEWMRIVENDLPKFDESTDRKIEIMRVRESEMKENASEYFKVSIPFYIKNKCRQEEFFKKITDITNEIVKVNMRELYAKQTANYPRLKTDRFFADYGNKYSYSGFMDEAFRFIEDFQLLNPELWLRFVMQFREDADYEAGWRGEYWGKMMRGACFVYSYTKNDKLYRILTQTVSDMMDSADENGRISSYAVSHEFDGWDIWCRKYVMLGMQYFLEICTDEVFANRIVESMCRQCDYIMDKIGEGNEKIPITSATRHWRGLNSSSLLEPVVRLYSLTNEQKYLDFAKYIVDCGGTDVVNIFDLAYENEFYPYQYPVTKAYEMMSCFEGLLEYYRITKNERHRTAIINFADRVLESDFTVIGCCGCTHELFDHSTVRQANTNCGKIMQETCVTVTLMKFLYQLNLLTGNPKYADAFEISLYNAYLGSINIDKVIEPSIAKEHSDWNIEPLPFDSYSPLTAGTRGNGIGGLKVMSDNHYYGCCACIGSAGIGLVPKMQLLTTEKGFAMNLFINGCVETRTPQGQKIVFETKTEYPKSGAVAITIHVETEEKFELLIRNPYWSKETKLSVNSESIDVCEEYISIERVWKEGDATELSFDMRTEAIYPIAYGEQILMNRVVWGRNYIIPTYDKEDEIAHRHIALRRGPIMLAQENRLGYSVDEPVEITVGKDGYADVVIPKIDTAPYAHIVEAEVPLAGGDYMTVTDYASAGKLWTEESKMAVWILTK